MMLVAAPATLIAQRTHVLSADQISKTESYRPIQDKMELTDRQTMVMAPKHAFDHSQTPSPNGKVAAVNPVQLGTSSNSFTILRAEQNQVAVDNESGAVAFIHRTDISVWGGLNTDNGRYRYDLSIDQGSSFSNDIGVLQDSIYLNYGRYPNVAFYNSGVANPFDTKLVYYGPTNKFPTPGWIGHCNGVAQVATSNPIATTEHYQFDPEKTLLPGGLNEGLPGEYWTVELGYDGNVLMDSIRIMKGTYQNGDVSWVIHDAFDPGFDRTYDGDIHAVGPNIAFSPDGMTGYIGMLSSMNGGTNTNSTYLPVFLKSTDGGATWGSAMEVDLDQIAWISDSLMTLWVDTSGAPVSNGEATTAFDFDMTVDGDGNVHMGVVIGTHADGFSISSGLAKFMADVYTPDGGTTWDVQYLSPVLTFRGTYGTGSQQLTVDNFPQVSRDDTGEHIFFSWVDSDTAEFTGTMNGIGFGESDNLSPNLRTTAKRTLDNALTYPQLVTDGDFIWEGRALNPTMAPTVVNKNGVLHLPIVVMDLITNDAAAPVGFWYMGNDASFDVGDENIWCESSSMSLNWEAISNPGGPPACAVAIDSPLENDKVMLNNWYPNPANGTARITFELPNVETVSMSLSNMYGQTVVEIASGQFNAGVHAFDVDTKQLAAGVYFCNLTSGDITLSKKLVVTK